MASSMSSINILNNSGEITDPCGTPAGQERFVERAPGSFTCCVRSVCLSGSIAIAIGLKEELLEI